MMKHRIPRMTMSWATPAILLLAFLGSHAGARPLPNGVAAGDVDQTSAVLWTRSDALGLITFDYSTQPSFDPLDGSTTAEVVDPFLPVKVFVAELAPGTLYYYRVTDAAGDQATGKFRTPEAAGLHGLRFGVSGDWRGELNPYPSISNIPERELDFFVALGDTIYADIPSVDFPGSQARTLEDFRIKHNEVYKERFGLASLQEARASTAILVTMDDHEVTNDFAGGAPATSDSRFPPSDMLINETELFQNGLQVFQEYNPLLDQFYGETGDPRTAGKRKLYRMRTYGSDAAIFLLDARSFRDAPLSPGDFATTNELENAFFDATRTMLGRVQLEELKSDLLACRDRDITWKFIVVPEPIQNLGPILAGDRFEGYAAERSDLLGFIDDNGIDNVVFVAADIHGTIVNNLVYRRFAGGPQLESKAFEITTGSVAFDSPFGPTVVQFIAPLAQLFESATRRGQNALVGVVVNTLFQSAGVPNIGLSRGPINARLLEGAYISINTYGWTEFEISAETQCLTVTTYGIDWYSEEELLADPDSVIHRTPAVVSRFRVEPRLDRTGPDALPRCNPRPNLCGAVGLVPFVLCAGLGFRRFSLTKRAAGLFRSHKLDESDDSCVKSIRK